MSQSNLFQVLKTFIIIIIFIIIDVIGVEVYNLKNILDSWGS